MTGTPRPVVFLPVTGGQASRLVAEGLLGGPLPGYSATADLCATFDLAPGGEDAEFAAFQVASVAALLAGSSRLVLVARPRTALLNQAGEQGNGGVEIGALELHEVEAFFTDTEPSVCRSASRGAAGHTIDEAWELPEVQAVLAEPPLSGHDVSELAAHLELQEG